MTDNQEEQYKYCLRCGRRLKTLENRLRGMGKICWEKSHKPSKIKPLFDLKNNFEKN